MSKLSYYVGATLGAVVGCIVAGALEKRVKHSAFTEDDDDFDLSPPEPFPAFVPPPQE